MARGIVTTKPGSTGGTTKGRILLTDEAIPSGTGSDTIGGDGTTSTTTGTTAAATFPAGSYASFDESTTANVGDIVDFAVDASGNASGLRKTSSGTTYTGTVVTNITVAAGQSAVVNAANFDGKITVNGGFLVVIGNTKAEGKFESSTPGSFIFIDSCVHEGKIEVTGSSKLIIQNSTVEGKVTSSGNLFASVTGCTIKGKLEVLNATDCFICNNNVEGSVNTPNCRTC